MGRPLPAELSWPDVEGDVQLGMPGSWANDMCELSHNHTTKIGGQPDWPASLQPFRSELLMCPVCGGYLGLVAQVHAPLVLQGLQSLDRTIYILGCPASGCGSDPACWRAIRVQKEVVEPAEMGNDTVREEIPRTEIEEISAIFTPAISGSVAIESRAEASSVESTHSREVQTGDWWDDTVWGEPQEEGDPVAGGAEILNMQMLESSLMEAGRLAANAHESRSSVMRRMQESPSTSQSEVRNFNFPVLPCFYIYFQAEVEPTTHESSSSSPVEFLQNILPIEERHDPFVIQLDGGDLWAGEEYEPDQALYADRTYLRFKRSLDHHPEQCIRYCFGGQVLSAVEEFKEEPGRCASCGGPRVYEMQLMPPLLYFLQQANKDLPLQPYGLDDWEWFTIIIFSCAQSCVQESDENALPEEKTDWSIIEEAIVIQQEFPRVSSYV